MIKKIIQYAFSNLQFVSNKLNRYKVSDTHMISFVCVYFILLFTLFVVGWLHLWYVKGISDLPLLLKGIETLTAPAALAAIKFVTEKASETFLDVNNNGIDDREENLEDKEC